jgi:hypothetical protein
MKVFDGQADVEVDGRLSRARRWWPMTLQVLGVILLGVGFGMITVYAGLIASGIGLLAFGVAEELARARE